MHHLRALAVALLLSRAACSAQPAPPRLTAPPPLAATSPLAALPPMGWNPWNSFGVTADGLPHLPWGPPWGWNDTTIRAVARAMADSGLLAAGYE